MGVHLSATSGLDSEVMQCKQPAPPSGSPTPAGECTPPPHRAAAVGSGVPHRQHPSQAEPRLAWKEAVILFMVTTAVLGPAIAFSPAGAFLSSIITPLARHHQLKTRSDSLEIGRLLVTMLENSPPDRTETIPSSDPRMPVRLRELGGTSLSLNPAQGFADLSCGDRAYHFGYAVSNAGDPQSAHYRMTCYGERVDDLVDLGLILRASSGQQIALSSSEEVRRGF